jgi:hypothetical protein
MKRPKIDTSGTDMANKAIADAQAAANNLRQNMSADLTNDNMTTAVAGGTADAVDTSIGTGTRRRRQSGSLSSSLGINV